MSGFIGSIVAFVLSVAYAQFMKRKHKTKGCSAIVLHRKAMKTSLCKEMSKCSGGMFVDINEIIDKQGNKAHEQKMIEAKEYMDTLRSNFKKRHIIVMTNDATLVKNLGIKAKNTHYYAPSSKLFEDLTKNIENPQVLNQINQSRTQEMFEKPKNKRLSVFDSFEQLKTMLVEQFKLERPL